METTIRPIRAEDAEACGQVLYQAHRAVAALHNISSEQPSAEFSIGLVRSKLNDANVYAVVAEQEGRIAGSVFLNIFPQTPVVAIGPLSVLPSAEGKVGRALMAAVMQEAGRRRHAQIRLVQSPSHLRSLALYSKMGFDAQEPLVLMQGALPQPDPSIPGRVRSATVEDIEICNRLCVNTHGFAREFELRAGIEQGPAMVVERSGRITGYCSGIGFRGHAVAESADDLRALISRSKMTPGPGFFVPVRNGTLFRWLLGAGLKAAWPAMLMSSGLYQQPRGAFLNSIAF
jgi:predicted N-acetyltransferase YhbS